MTIPWAKQARGDLSLSSYTIASSRGSARAAGAASVGTGSQAGCADRIIARVPHCGARLSCSRKSPRPNVIWHMRTRSVPAMFSHRSTLLAIQLLEVRSRLNQCRKTVAWFDCCGTFCHFDFLWHGGTGRPVPETAHDYRKRAAECWRAAKRARDPDAKLEFEKLAQAWERLAKQAEQRPSRWLHLVGDENTGGG
jgi:hypothetical protein